MQVIIPVAGKGTRMRPHTHSLPKPLLPVAGKPAIDYILEEISKLDFVTEVIFITGHLREKFEDYIREKYDFRMRFIEQNILDGTSGAVKLAQPYIKEDVLVIFADTIFDLNLNVIKKQESDGIIWAQKVEDYSRFGIMITDDEGYLQKLIEKPDEPHTRLANIGMYYVRHFKIMFECIDQQYEKKLSKKGEYYFPEALTLMADKGEKIKVMEVGGWYDTGKPETTLESQKILLEKRHSHGNAKNTEIIGKVYIDEDADVDECVIGPNVSISKGCNVKNSVIKNSIIGEDSEVKDCRLSDSLIGYKSKVSGVSGTINVGDDSEIVMGKHEGNP